MQRYEKLPNATKKNSSIFYFPHNFFSSAMAFSLGALKKGTGYVQFPMLYLCLACRFFYFMPKITFSMTLGKYFISSTCTLSAMSSAVSSGESGVEYCAMCSPWSSSALT